MLQLSPDQTLTGSRTMLIQVGEAKPRASKSRKLKCLIQAVIIIIIIIIIITTHLTHTVGWAKVGMVSAMRSWSQGATLYSYTQSHVSHVSHYIRVTRVT